MLILSERASRLPAIAHELAPLVGKISADDMRDANGAVDQDRRPISDAVQLLSDRIDEKTEFE
jgi:glycine betaine/choline ABC-type transport system substrate-binding protein